MAPVTYCMRSFPTQTPIPTHKTTFHILINVYAADTKGRDIGISVTVTLLLTITLNTGILLVGCAVYRSRSHHKYVNKQWLNFNARPTFNHP